MWTMARRQLTMSPEAYAKHQAKAGLACARSIMKPATFDLSTGKAVKKSKYRSQKTVVDGIKFDSKGEGECWKKLRLLEKAGKITHLQRQVSFPIYVNGKFIQRYKCDFWYIQPYGHNVIIADYKSEFTRNLNAWRRTKALFEAQYGLKIEEITLGEI